VKIWVTIFSSASPDGAKYLKSGAVTAVRLNRFPSYAIPSDEADTLTDQDIEMICRHAETMAQIVVQMFVESRRIPG